MGGRCEFDWQSSGPVLFRRRQAISRCGARCPLAVSLTVIAPDELRPLPGGQSTSARNRRCSSVLGSSESGQPEGQCEFPVP